MDVDIHETSVQNAGLDLAVDLVLSSVQKKSKHNLIKEEAPESPLRRLLDRTSDAPKVH